MPAREVMLHSGPVVQHFSSRVPSLNKVCTSLTKVCAIADCRASILGFGISSSVPRQI